MINELDTQKYRSYINLLLRRLEKFRETCGASYIHDTNKNIGFLNGVLTNLDRIDCGKGFRILSDAFWERGGGLASDNDWIDINSQELLDNYVNRLVDSVNKYITETVVRKK